MEVKLEGLDGTLPSKCFIGVRIGNVQKQAPYDPNTLYRFSEVKRFGKIDIYQRVGMCDLSWGCDDQETHTCNAFGDAGDTGIRLQVSMNRLKGNMVKSGDVLEVATAKSAKQAAAAKSTQYIQEQHIEVMLTAAMKSLLKTMPDDPAEFLCDFISKKYRKGSSTPQPRLLTEGKFEPYYRNHVLPSCGEAYFAAFHRRFFPSRQRLAGNASEADRRVAELTATVERLSRKIQHAEAKNAELTATVEKQRRQIQLLELVQVGAAPPAKDPQPPAPPAMSSDMRRAPQHLWNGLYADFPTPQGRMEVHPQRKEQGLPWSSLPSIGTWANPGPIPRALRERQSASRCKDLDGLRKRAALLFHRASQDGSLLETLVTVRGPDLGNEVTALDKLRDQTRFALIDASATGRLDGLLQEVGTSATEDVVNVDPLERIRNNALQLLTKASADGSLMSILQEAHGDCSAASQKLWCKKPSVGAWLATIPARPSCLK